MDHDFREAIATARRQGTLYFAALLPEERIRQAFSSASWFWKAWLYSPTITLWVFLAQCTSADHSCVAAVAQLIRWRISRGLKPCSAQTGGYCQARDRLPETACQQLVRDTGRQGDTAAPTTWLWHGRHVLDVDGATITMADTPENQKEYPQVPNQKQGCGFPIARIVLVFSLAMGTVIEAAIGKYAGKQTGENSLLRSLHPLLKSGDVVLGDRCFSGWFDIALRLTMGVDSVVRKHQLRATDFRTGRRLGPGDHCVRWPKPARPKWMSAEQYESLPAELEMREVRVVVRQKGFRTQELIVVTTLLDAEVYTSEELAKLYRRRWQAELNIRSLKIVMQMDHLRCQTPHRVRNEFYMHLVAYNLIRQVLAAAAQHAGREPWMVSFKGALQTLDAMLSLLVESQNSIDVGWEAMLDAIASHKVGHRPDRYEPRVKKRRPKKYKLMREPRENYRKRMAA